MTQLPDQHHIPDNATGVPELPARPIPGGLSPVTWRYLGLAALGIMLALLAILNLYGG